jgi:hypothetical protein
MNELEVALVERLESAEDDITQVNLAFRKAAAERDAALERITKLEARALRLEELAKACTQGIRGAFTEKLGDLPYRNTKHGHGWIKPYESLRRFLCGHGPDAEKYPRA